MNKQIVIPFKTILFTALFIFSLYVFYKIKTILFLLLLSVLIVLSVEQLIKFFMKQTLLNKPISRNVAVIVTYTLVIVSILVVLTIGLPPVVTQAQKLFVNISSISKDVPANSKVSKLDLNQLVPNISTLSQNLVSTTYSLVSNLLAIFGVAFIALYTSLDWENIKSKFYSLFHDELQKEIKETITEIETTMGHWIKGQIVLMCAVGLASFVGLLILDIDYPLALGLIAGLMEIVPALGPLISMVLAAIVGFSISLPKGLAVIGLFLLVQQLENNFLVPKIMHKVSGFSSLVILIAILVGSSLLGIVGALVAIPIMMISVIIFRRVINFTQPIN